MKKIKLTQGKYAVVDDEDYEELNQYKWYAWRDRTKDVWYARRSVHLSRQISKNGKHSSTAVRMHGQIMGSQHVDHINHDGLDNRRSNLRIASIRQNAQNSRKRRGASSSYKGVYWDKQLKHFRARIVVDGRSVHLGLFKDEVDAAHAYDTAAVKYFGEFASPNLP